MMDRTGGDTDDVDSSDVGDHQRGVHPGPDRHPHHGRRAHLLLDASGNTVASAITENIPTDPVVFWLLSGFILVFVCAIECLLIYIAFYSDISQCKQGKVVR